MKWEYRVWFLQGTLTWQDDLNELAKDGWELVAVSMQTAFLKRPLSP